MEDVVFLSERAVGKRKRQDDDDDVRKRVQVKDESSSDDDSSSSSESDNDSDDEPNARVENAMSAVRIFTEPQAAQPSSNSATNIRSEDRIGTSRMNRLTRSTNNDQHLPQIGESTIRSYFEELELAWKDRFPGGNLNWRTDHLRGCQNIWRSARRLEATFMAVLKKDDPLRRVVEVLATDDVGPQVWTEQTLTARIFQLKGHRANRHLTQATLAQGSRAPATAISKMEKRISALQAELRKEKGSRRGEVLACETRVKETLSTEIDKKDKKIATLKTAQQDLLSKIQQRDAEIAALKSSRPDSTTESQHHSSRDKKAVKKALEVAKTAEAKTNAMYTHYDVIQNKNSILIGKLTMMAQVGGFGNHGSGYRKELDALKAPPLSELEEYKEE